MRHKVELGIGVGVVAAALWFVGWSAERQSANIGAAVATATIQAMQRGYECHAAGRPFEDCRAEQEDRWKRVAVDRNAVLPKFGERAP